VKLCDGDLCCVGCDDIYQLLNGSDVANGSKKAVHSYRQYLRKGYHHERYYIGDVAEEIEENKIPQFSEIDELTVLPCTERNCMCAAVTFMYEHVDLS
jgi:hypothetical protein